jgi:hypothetical protein
MRLLAALLALTLACVAQVRPAWAAWPPDWLFLQSEEGWFFYKEPPPPRRAAEPPAVIIDEPEQPEQDSDDTLQVTAVKGPQLESWLLSISNSELQRLLPTVPAAALRAWAPVLMDQALTGLNRDSVRKYLLVHQETLRRSERFSGLWQELIWTDPAFDHPDRMPTGTLAQAIHEQETASRRTATLATLRRSLSLLLVVSPQCPTCEAQWKILQDWSTDSGFTVRPIAKELTTLADGAIALPYPGVIERLDIKQLPSLYLVEPATGYLTRLGSGLLTQDQIAERILTLTGPAVPSPNPSPTGEIQHVSE